MFILFLVVLALLLLSEAYDIVLTERGIKAGVAVEANSTITMFFGPKPTALQLFLHNTIIAAMAAGVALLGMHIGMNGSNPGIYGAGIGGMLSYTLLHLRGALKWRSLLNGGKLDNGPKSAWQKFLGF